MGIDSPGRGGEAPMISVTVNGKDRKLERPTALLSYLDSLGVNLSHIAVAYNGVVLRKEEFPQVTLSEGDRVEIVRAVGGG